MKTINEYVLNKTISSIDEYLLSKSQKKIANIPEIGRKAYDWCDEEWTIVDFCSCGDKEALKKFMSDYDASDYLEEAEYTDDDYLVAAENGKFITMFLWDEDSGLHYKN